MRVIIFATGNSKGLQLSDKPSTHKTTNINTYQLFHMEVNHTCNKPLKDKDYFSNHVFCFFLCLSML